MRTRWPLFSLGVFLFFAAHLITSNVIGLELAFEHRNHFALIGAVLAVGSLLAQASGEQPEVLRQQVTSKGGTTHAAISSMQDNKVHVHIIEAMQACYHRGLELGKEFA